MTSLDFLYIALGMGFLVLVIFLCVLILYLILILRDFTKVSNNAKDISDQVKKVVFEPLEVLSEVSQGWSFIHGIIEKIKQKYDESQMEDDDEDIDFKVKKISKR